MSWRRLRERFLARLESEDDVAALLRPAAGAGRGGKPVFLVALVDDDEDLCGAAPDKAAPSTPRRVSPSRSRGSANSAASSSRSSADPGSRGRQYLLGRAARQWIKRTGGALGPQKGKPSTQGRRLVFPGDPKRARDADSTRSTYLDALRSARRDVDKLRGAQAAAQLLADGDRRRVKRSWGYWKGANEVGSNARARQKRGALAVFARAGGCERGAKRNALFVLRGAVRERRAALKFGAAALIFGLLRSALRRKQRAVLR